MSGRRKRWPASTVRAMTPIIIGISGYLRSGKDTAGSVLRDELGYHHASFAAKLKDFLYAVDPPIRPATTPGRNAPALLSLRAVVDAVGWERAKDDYPDVRPLLQRTGTEAGRKVLWEDVWVDAVMGSLPAGRDVVFTDMRFPNEAQAIVDAGGITVRVDRPGFEPGPDAHPSETALDDWPFDCRITNDTTVAMLQAAIYGLHQSLEHERATQAAAVVDSAA